MEDRKILKSLLEGIINEQKSDIDSIRKSVESIDDSIQEKIISQLDSLTRITDILNNTVLNLLDNTPNIVSKDKNNSSINPSPEQVWWPNGPYNPDVVTNTIQNGLCPICGSPMTIDRAIVLTSNTPPQYKRKCPKCGYTDTIYSTNISYEKYYTTMSANDAQPQNIYDDKISGKGDDVKLKNIRESMPSNTTLDEFHKVLSELESGNSPTLGDIVGDIITGGLKEIK